MAGMDDWNIENPFEEDVLKKDIVSEDLNDNTFNQETQYDDFSEKYDEKLLDGYKDADTAFVLGLISVCAPLGFLFMSVGGPFVGLICGIIGLISSQRAKAKGYMEKKQRNGFVLSLIGTIINSIIWMLTILVVVLFFVFLYQYNEYPSV